MIKPKHIQFKASKSRGPGGQNVNKVNSAALLLWDFEKEEISEEQKYVLKTKLDNQINKEGLIYIRSDESRDLEKNKKRCLEKLRQLIKKAFFVPKARKKTKPTLSSIHKRISSKKNRGDLKKSRQKVKE